MTSDNLALIAATTRLTSLERAETFVAEMEASIRSADAEGQVALSYLLGLELIDARQAVHRERRRKAEQGSDPRPDTPRRAVQ